MSNLTNLDYDAAHLYVEKMQRQGKNVKWDGWNIEVHRPNPRGYFAKEGVFRNGKWGFVTSIAPDTNGMWRVREYSRPVGNRSR